MPWFIRSIAKRPRSPDSDDAGGAPAKRAAVGDDVSSAPVVANIPRAAGPAKLEDDGILVGAYRTSSGYFLNPPPDPLSVRIKGPSVSDSNPARDAAATKTLKVNAPKKDEPAAALSRVQEYNPPPANSTRLNMEDFALPKRPVVRRRPAQQPSTANQAKHAAIMNHTLGSAAPAVPTNTLNPGRKPLPAARKTAEQVAQAQKRAAAEAAWRDQEKKLVLGQGGDAKAQLRELMDATVKPNHPGSGVAARATASGPDGQNGHLGRNCHGDDDGNDSLDALSSHGSDYGGVNLNTLVSLLNQLTAENRDPDLEACWSIRTIAVDIIKMLEPIVTQDLTLDQLDEWVELNRANEARQLQFKVADAEYDEMQMSDAEAKELIQQKSKAAQLLRSVQHGIESANALARKLDEGAPVRLKEGHMPHYLTLYYDARRLVDQLNVITTFSGFAEADPVEIVKEIRGRIVRTGIAI